MVVVMIDVMTDAVETAVRRATPATIVGTHEGIHEVITARAVAMGGATTAEAIRVEATRAVTRVGATTAVTHAVIPGTHGARSQVLHAPYLLCCYLL